jgi:excinuclease ABC subunit C
VTPHGAEIRIDNQQTIFSFVGTIQEETHRFAITYHRQLRSKRLKYSELDQISGIGQKRKQDLLKHFKSITAISAASVHELERILPAPTAMAVYSHFRQKTDEKENI